MSMWAALEPPAFPWQWAGRDKPGQAWRAGQRGSERQASGGLMSRVHGTKAVLGAASGSGDTRTMPMLYSFTKPSLSSWSWAEMLFAHWKRSPNNPTGMSFSSSFCFPSPIIPPFHGQPPPGISRWMWWLPPLPRAAELTGEDILLQALTVSFWERDKKWEKHVTVN